MTTGDPRLDLMVGDIFERVFSSSPVAGGAVAVEMALSPAELANGAQKRVEIVHPGECTVCVSRTCPACDGRGYRTHVQGVLTIQRRCDCAGGRIFDRRCPACHGTGATTDVVDVTVPPGSEAGQVVVIDGEGDLVDGERGDLHVHLSVAGIDIPRATLHAPERRPVAGFAAVLALALGGAVLLSLLW